MRDLIIPRRLMLLPLAFALSACPQEKPAATTPAATVKNAVAESQLATVILSEDAVRRLGITTAPVERRAVVGVRAVGGETIAPPGLAVPVSAPVAGTVGSPPGGALPAVGARVTQGMALATFTPLAPSGDLVRSREEATAARARADVAAAEAIRVEALHRDGLVSTRALELAMAERTASTAAVLAAEARLASGGGVAGEQPGLDPLVLRSPLPGVVSEVHVGANQSVVAGAPLFLLLSADRVWVRVPVYAGDVATIDRRATARVVPLGSTTTASGYPARPVAGPPTADPRSASVDLYYELGNPGGRFRPGERVTVELPLSAVGGPTLVVPWSAIVYDANGGAWVYRQTDPVTFTRARVAVRGIRGDWALLDQGPEPGTRIVSIGAAELFGTEFGAGK